MSALNNLKGCDDMTDDRILKGLREQETAALEAMMGKYRSLVTRIISNVLGSAGTPDDVEELCSDTFFAVWTYARGVKNGKLKAYLSTTARNKAKTFLRERRELPMDLDMVEIPDMGPTPEDCAIEQELSRMIRRAIDRMRPKDREIFLRYYYYFETTGEIAQRMGIPDATVRSRLSRGRKILQKSLSKED